MTSLYSEPTQAHGVTFFFFSFFFKVLTSFKNLNNPKRGTDPAERAPVNIYTHQQDTLGCTDYFTKQMKTTKEKQQAMLKSWS